MIDTTTARKRWRSIQKPALKTGNWTRIGLGDGILDMKASIEAGTFVATFRALCRELTAEEEMQLVAACQVPAPAERVPAVGQERVSMFRPGIIGGWYGTVMYRWKVKP